MTHIHEVDSTKCLTSSTTLTHRAVEINEEIIQLCTDTSMIRHKYIDKKRLRKTIKQRILAKMFPLVCNLRKALTLPW